MNKFDNSPESDISNKSHNSIRNKKHSPANDKGSSEHIKSERENGKILEQILSDMAWHG